MRGICHLLPLALVVVACTDGRNPARQAIEAQAEEAAEVAAHVATDAAYACPMHPDEAAHAPGSCAVCGMALVAVADDGEDAGTDAAYVCPMHPEQESDESGPCPVCGMALTFRGDH